VDNAGKVGIGTTTPGAKLDVHVSKGGAATIGDPSNSATGELAIAMGYGTTASGKYSTAMGYRTKAKGDYSTAFGGYTTASGMYSTAFGDLTKASGMYSTAMGTWTTASGRFSTATGYNTIASGNFSTAMGLSIEANGSYSFGIGLNSKATPWKITQLRTMAIMGGRVGIGTVSPQRDLHVDDTMRLEPRSSAPSSPSKGDIYFNSVKNTLAVYTGSSWKYVALTTT
jgi:hypothetical protein